MIGHCGSTVGMFCYPDQLCVTKRDWLVITKQCYLSDIKVFSISSAIFFADHHDQMTSEISGN